MCLFTKCFTRACSTISLSFSLSSSLIESGFLETTRASERASLSQSERAFLYYFVNRPKAPPKNLNIPFTISFLNAARPFPNSPPGPAFVSRMNNVNITPQTPFMRKRKRNPTAMGGSRSMKISKSLKNPWPSSGLFSSFTFVLLLSLLLATALSFNSCASSEEELLVAISNILLRRSSAFVLKSCSFVVSASPTEALEEDKIVDAFATLLSFSARKADITTLKIIFEPLKLRPLVEQQQSSSSSVPL